VITTRIGDLFPALKASLLNFVVKRIKHMVPPWDLPGSVSFNAALKLGARSVMDNVPLTAADTAFLQYTGGTTGVAKGAILTHGNLTANVEQTSAWIGATFREGEEVIVTPLPLYHIFGLTANLLTFVKWGANNILITNPRDIPKFIKELTRTRFTAITGVNTLFCMLLQSPDFEKVRKANAGALKVSVAGGMSVQRRVAEDWQRMMGVPLIEGYGLTEASPIVCANPMDATGFSGKIGMPVPSTQIEIRDAEGNALDFGESGEICVKGPQVMAGYWNMPEETSRVLTTDGWLRTGDIGVMDESGYIRFIDRLKDVIIVSGFNVYPAEIEEVVMMHPGVKEAGVVGVPDERSGETVKVYLVQKDPSVTSEAIIAHCRKNLAPYKVPRHVEFCLSLPKSPIGKVLRRRLKEIPSSRA
jgi:long-chain acyl-CoA synthetase